MPADYPSAFLVSQSASTSYCRKNVEIMPSLLSKFLTTALCGGISSGVVDLFLFVLRFRFKLQMFIL